MKLLTHSYPELFASMTEAATDTHPESSLQQEPDQTAVVVRLKLHRLHIKTCRQKVLCDYK